LTRGSLAALVAYTLLLSVAAPAVLRRAAWVTRAPRLAIRLWRALSASWLVAVTLVGLTVAVSVLASPEPGTFPRVVAVPAGVLLAVGIIARAGYIIARELTIARRTQMRHAERLACAGRPLSGVDATVVEHDTPAVYCLPAPRRQRQIVVTTGALHLLGAHELNAVLAHEQAHLRGRDHLIASVAASLSLAFPCVPLFRHARDEIAILTEMAADDAASSQHGAGTIASALASLAKARTPSPALGAGGHTVMHRLQRLLAPPQPLCRAAKLTGTVASIGALTLPLGLSCVTVTIVAGLTISAVAG
jgi:Zn-dependent protease with chaperone function